MFCRIADKRSQPAKDAPRGKQKEAKEWGRAKIRFEKLLQDIQEMEWFSEGMAPPASCLALAILFDTRRQISGRMSNG